MRPLAIVMGMAAHISSCLQPGSTKKMAIVLAFLSLAACASHPFLPLPPTERVKGPPLVTQRVFRTGSDARTFFVENDTILVSFARANGVIDSIVHKASGADLRSLKSGTWIGTWAIEVAQPNGSPALPFP